MNAEINLKNAESGGVRFQGKRVILRMRTALEVNSKDIVAPRGEHRDLKIEGLSPYGTFERKETLKWHTFPLPAEDEEMAARLGRALEQQIETCGGKRDPFAR